MTFSRILGVLAAALTGLLLGWPFLAWHGAVVPALAQNAAPAAAIPNFWDPKRRIARPLPGAIESIRFITTDDFPPFNFVDSAGRLTGFHVDLARAICDEISVPCTIQARPWDNLVPTLEAGQADAAIAGIGISAEMRSKMGFSDIYLATPARFAVRNADREADMSPDSLVGRSVGVVGETAHEAYLAAYFPGVQRRLFDTHEAARTALREGQVYAYFGDAIQVSFWLLSDAADGCCSFAGGPYIDTHFFGHGMAVAVRRDQPALRDAINSALDVLHANGVYGELYLRYFPLGFL